MTSVIDAVLAVFTGIAEWIGDAVQGLIPMFYASETGLTFLGVLTAASLGFGVILLLINVIKSFLRFQ